MFDKTHAILAHVSSDFVIQGLQTGELRRLSEEVLARTGRLNRRACPLNPLLVLWLVVAMALYRNLSIPNVFERLLHLVRRVNPRLGRRPVTPEALCHARERLRVLPLKLLHGATVAHYLGPVPATFRGLRVYALDGCEFTVPDTPANEAVFGRHVSQRGDAAYPQVRGVFLTAAVLHQIRYASFVPSSCSERSPVSHLLKNLGLGDLVLIDRGLGSFEFFLDCGRREVSYLARLSGTWKPTVLKALGKGDSLVELRPCKAARNKLRGGDKDPRIVARLLEFRVGTGDRIRLLTDLVDPIAFSALELAREYHSRWECELTYKELKIELLAVTEGKQKTHFRSKTPMGVLQEAWGAVLAHTLVRQLIFEGASEAGVPALEISFVESLEVIKMALPDLQTATRKQLLPLRAQLLRAIGQCRIERPRRPRMFPRKVKRKMSNFHLKGPGDRERPLDLTIFFME